MPKNTVLSLKVGKRAQILLGGQRLQEVLVVRIEKDADRAADVVTVRSGAGASGRETSFVFQDHQDETLAGWRFRPNDPSRDPSRDGDTFVTMTPAYDIRPA